MASSYPLRLEGDRMHWSSLATGEHCWEFDQCGFTYCTEYSVHIYNVQYTFMYIHTQH